MAQFGMNHLIRGSGGVLHVNGDLPHGVTIGLLAGDVGPREETGINSLQVDLRGFVGLQFPVEE